MAYDVRFEVYDREFFDRLQVYAGETGADWKSFADGYRIVIVDETRRSHTADFLKEPGARALPRRRDHGHPATAPTEFRLISARITTPF